MNISKSVLYALAAFSLSMTPLWAGEDHEHHETAHEAPSHADEGHAHKEENRVHLRAEQIQTAGIRVRKLQKQRLPAEIQAPGEILLNAYSTSEITPRIEAQVVARHARLGDVVEKGQKLVTLSSAEMAAAQGEALIAAKDWQRVKKLGKQVVSEQRYLETKIAWQQAQARLLAYGMTQAQIQTLIQKGNIAQADGRFALLSLQDGTVIEDDFILGQMIEPGQRLFKITDESSIWVEAHVNPKHMHHIRIGQPTRIVVNTQTLHGRVIQIHHQLDETTRTMSVRIEVPNPGDHLHPGQFVRAFIQTQALEAVLAVPQDALLRSPDGDWQVYVAHADGEFEAVEVEPVRQLGEQVVIEGLPEGTPVVVNGAFFVQSEQAKSGFAVHNH